MNELEKIKDVVVEKLPNLKWKLDIPDDESGSTWLDLNLGNDAITIEWRPNMGFGVFIDDEESYGNKPTEIYRSPEILLSRIDLLIRDKRDLKIREIRELLGLSQEDLGKLLGQKQASISKMESRRDLMLTTMFRYIHALGGHIEIKAHFDDCDVPLSSGYSNDNGLFRNN